MLILVAAVVLAVAVLLGAGIWHSIQYAGEDADENSTHIAVLIPFLDDW